MSGRDTWPKLQMSATEKSQITHGQWTLVICHNKVVHDSKRLQLYAEASMFFLFLIFFLYLFLFVNFLLGFML